MNYVRWIALVLVMLGASVPRTFAQDGSGITDYIQYSAYDGQIAFEAPSTWTADATIGGPGIIVLVSDKSLLDRQFGDPYQPGQVSVVLSFLDIQTAEDNGLVGDTIGDKLTFIVDQLTKINTDEAGNSLLVTDGVQLVEATDITFEVAQVTYSLGDNIQTTIIFWNVTDEILGTAIINTAENRWEEAAPTVNNIVQSTAYIGDIDFSSPPPPDPTSESTPAQESN